MSERPSHILEGMSKEAADINRRAVSDEWFQEIMPTLHKSWPICHDECCIKLWEDVADKLRRQCDMMVRAAYPHPDDTQPE